MPDISDETRADTAADPTQAEITRRAQMLFQKAEHLDPSDDGDHEADDWGWSKLTTLQRHFWECLVREAMRWGPMP